MDIGGAVAPGAGFIAAGVERTRDASRLGDAQETFAAVISRSRERGGSVREQARRAAEEFVSIALVQPLLAQLRSSNTAAAPFAPTQGERQLQSLMDAQVAQRVVHAKRFALVDRVAEGMLRRAGRGQDDDGAAETDRRERARGPVR